jgi:hypothetical protein
MAAAGTSDSVKKPDFKLRVAEIVSGPDGVETFYTKRQALRMVKILDRMYKQAYATKTDQMVRLYDGRGNEWTIALDADTVTSPMPSRLAARISRLPG